ncbi:AraC family transcriptional regulator [Advenella alkanexedens]|uniref:AraC family transcriptional regulator n=1 Tax=Advenella alkanexedens TaxID=1481665 RepID=UPI0026773388|nr:AraC family transcriptional regulator [Advenella alkanexedens]WKU20526.1 AraC family transcriptional regulator [Advenella alkanexedens]
MEAQTISVRFINVLLMGASKHSTYNEKWITKTGLSPALLELEGTRITMSKFAQLYRVLAIELNDETPGLFSRPLRNGTLKYLCMIMLDAPDLGVALNRFRNFFHLVNDDVEYKVRTCPNGLIKIELEEKNNLGPTRTWALELLLMLVQGVSSWLIRRKIPFVSIAFPFSKPGHAAEYEQLYPGPVTFNQNETALYMDPVYLHEPIRQDQSELNEFIRNAPLNWFYFSPNDRPYTHQLRHYLQNRLHENVTINDVALIQHISPRTLARHLASEGTTFQKTKDKLRRDIAIDLLNKTDTPIATIGNKLGFEDPAAFNRAFKMWTGSTPGAYRKQTILQI